MLVIRDRSGRELVSVAGSRVALVLVELASAVSMVAIALLAGRHQHLWGGPLVLVLALLAMVLPDSEAGLLTLLAYGGWWFAADRSASWGAVLAAALAVAAFHLALAHAAAAPRGATTHVSVLRALVGEAGVVVAATALAALVSAAIGVSGLHAPTSVIGVALMSIGLLPWIAALGRRAD